MGDVADIQAFPQNLQELRRKQNGPMWRLRFAQPMTVARNTAR